MDDCDHEYELTETTSAVGARAEHADLPSERTQRLVCMHCGKSAPDADDPGTDRTPRP
jgi:hypothetical protein